MKPNVDVRVVRECDLEGAIDAAIARWLNQAALHVLNITKERAPVDQGYLRSAMINWPTAKAGDREIHAGIPSGTPSESGGRATIDQYATYLDQPKSRDPHYRGTTYAGEPTRGWFSDGVAQADEGIRKMADVILADIDDAWARAS